MAKTPEQRRMDADERRWKAESDARTLCGANEIKGDKPRLGRAVKAATRLAREAEKEAKSIRQVAQTPKKAKRRTKRRG